VTIPARRVIRGRVLSIARFWENKPIHETIVI
jgi:hypothetical protein